jgi:hypothetical protein
MPTIGKDIFFPQFHGSTLSDQRVAKMRGDGNLKNAYQTSTSMLGRGLDLVSGRARYAQLSGTPRPQIQYFL